MPTDYLNKPDGFLGYVFCGVSSLVLLLAVTSCGTGTESAVGADPSTVSTEQLQRSAASTASKSIGTSMDGALGTLVSSSAVNSTLNLPGISNLLSSDSTALSDATAGNRVLNDDLGADTTSGVDSLFEATLGLHGASNTSRDSDRITIDPDESRVCQEELLGMNSSATELSRCIALLSDLTVRIDAETDVSGLITYLFRNQPVMLVEYAPARASYEVKLAGLHAVLTRNAELDPESDPVPDSMAGGVKLSARVLNDTAGAEAGTISVSITEHLNIANTADGLNLTIAPSMLLQVIADAANGTATLEVDVGALQIATRDNDIAGNPLTTLSMAGLTVQADLTRDGDILTVSNLGLGKGPFVVTVDSVESVRATLETMGFMVDQHAGQITLLGALNFNLDLANAQRYLETELSPDWNANYSILAPTGTVFSENADGSLRVNSGGPFQFAYEIFDGLATATGTLNVAAGGCIDEDTQSDAPLVEHSCP